MRGLAFTVSWLLWGIGFYLYLPFLSIFLAKITSPSSIPEIYFISQLSSLPFPILGMISHKKIGSTKTIIIGMIISSLGLFLLGFSRNIYEAIASLTTYYFFYFSLPSYYVVFKSIGDGTIERIWGISVSPSIISPFLGGIIASYFGYKILFLISGLFVLFSVFPILKENNVKGGNSKIRISPIILLIIIPIAISMEFIFLEIKLLFSFSDTEIGILASIAEFIGMMFSIVSSFFFTKKLLPLSILLFSIEGLSIISPYFAIFYGFWEVIIPVTLEIFSNSRSVEDFASINFTQSLGWTIGYAITSIIRNITIAIEFSSLISIILSIILFIRINKT
ncbi:hypothetical protein [Acidianus brierleyi]|uniref:MFS transporter n=1 Tax=Acidianus brierleyi TaxID=41673 RepID=A0A2U9IGL2_9CREN|nr:hypothetical protein [Acidianus brierleyi]AWR95178.1 hypothetical protein DFR85_11795 [Acidianus brierleyi]